MFADGQLNVVVRISIMTLFGGVVGAFVGALIGAIVRYMRTAVASSLLTGAAYGLMAGAATSGATALILGIAETLVFGLNAKGVSNASTAFVVVQFSTVLASGGLVVLLSVSAHTERPRRLLPRLVLWAAIGTLLGAIALVWIGASESFWKESAEPLVRWCIFGGAFGCATSVMWRLLVEWFSREEEKARGN